MKFKLMFASAAMFSLMVAGCTNSGSDKSLADRDTTKADGTAVTSTNDVDFNSPAASYEEISDSTIKVQGNGKYAIYSLGDDILFNVDQSQLKSSAENSLKMIGESLKKRFKGASIGIYGHADSTGSKSYNKDLGKERAAAVRNWFMKNENIPADKIAIVSFGEANPVATNSTAKGRQENRSVSIVVTPVKEIHTP